MEDITKDILFKVAIDLNLSDLLHLCQTNRRFNNLFCNNDEFWRIKLYREFPETINKINKKILEKYEYSYKDIYKQIINKNYVISKEDFDKVFQSTKVAWWEGEGK